MKTLGITGAFGFFGWHLRCRVRAARPDLSVRLAGRETFESAESLDSFVDSCDAIVHLAGANRGEPSSLLETNGGLADSLVTALRRTGSTPRLAYANSSHESRDTPYGRSKREAAAILADWAQASGSTCADLVFPNLFGEHGRPFYNSAVATFCFQVSRAQACEVNPEGVTELLHVQDAAASVLDAIDHGTGGKVRIPGERMAIPELHDRLVEMASSYQAARIPELVRPLDRQLFNTLRSYMFPDRYPMPLDLRRDARGHFAEIARGYGKTQVSFSSTRPGVTRGNHFHLEKIERFVVLSGSAVIRVRKLFDDRVHEFAVSGDRPAVVDIPTLHTHDITNVGKDDLLTAFWAYDHFDAAAPDTYLQDVAFTERAEARA